jgi:dienelactone hydrolase
MKRWSILAAIAISVALASLALADVGEARVEVLPIETLTLSDAQFLTGDAAGTPATVTGALRIAPGTGRRPLVVFIAGSDGFGSNTEAWDRQFEAMGISTFALDGFAGRGIASLVADQSKLGRLNMILDLYRALAILAAHPRVDPARIAVMGFSRGGQVALYASLRRFQTMWNRSGVEPAAYIALYPPCVTSYIGDTDVSDRPIRIFHGAADDYVEIAPCRAYVARLRAAGKDATLTEFPGAGHAFDDPDLPATPTVVPNAETTHCVLKEEPAGVIVNTATMKPFTYGDRCVGRDPHVAYSAAATRATEAAVKKLLRTDFGLK